MVSNRNKEYLWYFKWILKKKLTGNGINESQDNKITKGHTPNIELTLYF